MRDIMDIKKRKNAIKALAVFLIFMGVCYIVAKGIYANAMPIVNTRPVSEGVLTHEFTVYGSLRQGQEFGIYVPQGLMVSTIYVFPGETVNEGEKLFRIDITDLNKLICEKEIEIADLDAQLEQEDNSSESGQVDLSEYETLVTRAREDYNRTVATGNLEISRKNELLENARSQLEAHKKTKPEADDTVSGSDFDARLAEYKSKLAVLKQNVKDAEQALQDAQILKDTQVLQSMRSLEDALSTQEKAVNAEPSTGNESVKKALQLKVSFKREELEQLKGYKASEGEVVASEAGYITASMLEVGSRTMDSAAMRYTRVEDEKVLDVYLDEVSKKYLDIGDSVVLIFGNGQDERNIDAQVNYIEQNGTTGIAHFYLDDDKLNVGQSARVRFSKKTEKFSTCIPSQALNMTSQNTGYVFVLEESEGFFGKEYIVKQVNVTVQDSTERLCALMTGDLAFDDQVVVSTDRDLHDGQVVRTE